ncbi:MAG: hypothetical protein Q8P12_07920, partial [bacterium]|nr:hypothetical protein [bacterium]
NGGRLSPKRGPVVFGPVPAMEIRPRHFQVPARLTQRTAFGNDHSNQCHAPLPLFSSSSSKDGSGNISAIFF